MAETDDATGGDRTGRRRDGTERGETRLGKGVDWLVTGLLVLAGLLGVLLGVFLNAAADRDEIVRLVAEGTVESTVLTDAELVDVTYALVWWGGVGVAVTGLLLVVGGVAFMGYRRRVRRRRAETGVTGPDATTNAIVGAIVTIVTSFVPLSPILGGIVAGYLQKGERMDGVRVGGLSGLVVSLPLVFLFAFLVGGLFVVSSEVGTGVEVVTVAVGFGIGLLVAVLFVVVLSAIGGYVGSYLAGRGGASEERQPPLA